MSKVLFVNQTTGVSYAVDTEGNPTTVGDGELSWFEATTAMNRLADGHVEIPADHYAIRVDIVTNRYEREELKISQIVVLDEEGNHRSLKTYTEDDLDIMGRMDDGFGTTYQVLLTKLNSETDVVQWAMNPLMTDAFTFSFDEAPKVDTGTPMAEMLYQFRRQQLQALEPVEVLFTTYIQI